MSADIGMVIALKICEIQKLSHFAPAIDWEASVVGQWEPPPISCAASLVTLNLQVSLHNPHKGGNFW